MSVLASMSLTASAAGNGILVLVACILAFVAAGVAWFLTPRAIWGTLTALALALYFLALLLGP